MLNNRHFSILFHGGLSFSFSVLVKKKELEVNFLNFGSVMVLYPLLSLLHRSQGMRTLWLYCL